MKGPCSMQQAIIGQVYSPGLNTHTQLNYTTKNTGKRNENWTLKTDNCGTRLRSITKGKGRHCIQPTTASVANKLRVKCRIKIKNKFLSLLPVATSSAYERQQNVNKQSQEVVSKKVKSLTRIEHKVPGSNSVFSFVNEFFQICAL